MLELFIFPPPPKPEDTPFDVTELITSIDCDVLPALTVYVLPDLISVEYTIALA